VHLEAMMQWQSKWCISHKGTKVLNNNNTWWVRYCKQFNLLHNAIIISSYSRTAYIPSTWSPTQLSFLWQHLIISTQLLYCSSLQYIQKMSRFTCTKQQALVTVRLAGHSKTVGPQYGTCSLSPFWHLDFWGGY
jgi:hypothetical protein